MFSAPKYEVLGEIGRGGTGLVYKVRHLGLDTVVAVKVMHPEVVGDAELVARFEREARVMARLTHRNIVRVLDIDAHDGVRFIVMEHVEGTNLEQVLRQRGRLPLAESLEIAAQVAHALAYAHGQGGVIHRDIKPSNIIVEAATRRAVVTDFGIAKLAGQGDQTRSSSFLGTLRYCAPEQARGGEVDARVDVYGLGLVLYEMLSGVAAYGKLTGRQVLARLIAPEEKPLPFPEDCPPAVRALVVRATARNVDERFATAADCLAAIEHLREQHAADVVAAGTRPRAADDDTWVFGDGGPTRVAPSVEAIRDDAATILAATSAAQAGGGRAWRSALLAGGLVLPVLLVGALWLPDGPGHQWLAARSVDTGPPPSASRPADGPPGAAPAPAAAAPPAPAADTLTADAGTAPANTRAPMEVAALPAAQQVPPPAPAGAAGAAGSVTLSIAAPANATAPAMAADDAAEPVAAPAEAPAPAAVAAAAPAPVAAPALADSVAALPASAPPVRAPAPRATVAARPQRPRFVHVTPAGERIELVAGRPRLFTIDAEVPEADDPLEGLSFEWQLDGATQAGSGDRFELAVADPGEHRLAAVVRGPNGTTATHEWQVDVTSTAAAAPEAAREPALHEIEIVELTDTPTRDKRNLLLEGRVRNRGTQEIERLVVLVQALDERGGVVTEGDGVPAPQPLPPGEVAFFRLRVPNDDAIRGFRVQAFPR